MNRRLKYEAARAGAAPLVARCSTQQIFLRWSVPAFLDTRLGCQFTELPIS
jgi:hypothetical protein